MQTFAFSSMEIVVLKTFYKDNEKQVVGPGSVFLEHLEVQILNIFQGLGLMDVPFYLMSIYIYIYIYIIHFELRFFDSI